jgi:Mn2+/Fe2+ NRAMP family transporter
MALKPIAGEGAFFLFAAGIIGTGLLAVPVLAGSAAYAVAGAFGWREGLDLKPAMGKRFYAIIALSTAIGVVLGISDTDPIKALFWTAVINGVISVPIMVVMMRMGEDRRIMGPFVITKRLKWLGWLATVLMALSVIVMLFTLA